jgi:hypothetical protein
MSKNMEKSASHFIKSKKNHEPQGAYKTTSTKTKNKGMYRKSFNTYLSKMVLPREKMDLSGGD